MVGKTKRQYKLEVADREQIDSIFSDHIEKECSPYFANNKDRIGGIIAFDQSGKNVGFITWLENPLMPPLSGKQWYIPYLYVMPEDRKKGIARELISALMNRASVGGVQQLLTRHPNEEIMQYWYDLGFDVFIFRYLFKTKNGKYPIAIGKNIM